MIWKSGGVGPRRGLCTVVLALLETFHLSKKLLFNQLIFYWSNKVHDANGNYLILQLLLVFPKYDM